VKPSDPRVRAQLRPARRPLTAVLVAGGLSSLLVVAQAFALAGFIVVALDGRLGLGWAAVVVAVFLARGLVGWVSDVAAARAAAAVADDMRHRLVGSLLDGGAHPGRARSS